MARIFISYNRECAEAAQTLLNDFQALGHTVWLDQKLSGGQAWWDQILATIRDCDLVAILLSPGTLKSTACKREYNYAADLGKPILPVVVADGISTNLLPPALSQIQLLDYREADRSAAFRLAKALVDVPPPKPLPDPLPPPPEIPISYLGNLTEQIETTKTLSYEAQSALLVDLKRGLHETETAADTRALLKRLRKRRDLYATIAEEIDELLAEKEEASSVSQNNIGPEPSFSKFADEKPFSKHLKGLFPKSKPKPQKAAPTEVGKKFSGVKPGRKVAAVLVLLISVPIGGMVFGMIDEIFYDEELAVGGLVLTILIGFILARKIWRRKKQEK